MKLKSVSLKTMLESSLLYAHAWLEEASPHAKYAKLQLS